ncbi:chaperone protein dnaJ 20, chloroplastic [Syzygium oleosum]|uniref:chaperone protein dnaJ 20, chloroplastic n=1 Tax=Syzygium oleosum TaxID=219896 RepID=UPI0011D1CE13|nr:chaperone protein dnaJ 20, chloroplastic [Syzygium oleosum]
MQAHHFVGPVPILPSRSHAAQSSTITHHLHRRRWRPISSSSSSSSPSSWPAIDGGGEQNHYDVLGLTPHATSGDIKRAYRLLARKYHPDVSKDLQAGEVFKTIRRAYEVLSNEAARTHYDKALKFQEDTGRQYKGKWYYNPEYEDGVRIYRWAELRRKMQHEMYRERYKADKDESSFYGETEEVRREHFGQERGAFTEVLRSAFLLLFFMRTLGCRISLTFSSFTALLDRKLDAGYKIGYVIAWILGGRGGILLTLCLSFASWVCGKSSSNVVVLVVVAMWVGSNLARYAPLPQGALLTLLYMSIKLQVDLN